ncbi:hypothetical protein ABGB18_11055 [Nonomuraea sp. B12E4]|uniref:hypothetical protein n=1 Tax=Nonomuraea sp. B12E4 TaxID=3153564 RepID=UPI00325E38EE
MIPAEVIEKALRENMRVCAGVPMSGREAEDAARIAIDALAQAGLVSVSAEDLYHVAEIAENYLDMCEPPPADELERVARLRAALPERTTK